jgi:Helix-turn-helix domain
VTTDEPGLSRPDAARYLGLSVGTLRNYHREEKLVPTWDEEGMRWMYPLPLLDRFVKDNVLLTAKGERPHSSGTPGHQ